MLRSIKLSIGCLIIGTVFLHACRSNEIEPNIPAGYVELQAGRLTLTRVGVTVIADTVKDFICPINAACSAPNNVSTSIRLIKGSESRAIRLSAWIDAQYTNTAVNDSTQLTLGGQSYKVVLRGQYINSSTGARRGRAVLQVSSL